MAIFTSENLSGTRFDEFNVYWYSQDAVGGNFADNIFFNYNGFVYEDIVSIYLSDGFDITVGGQSIVTGPNYSILGGTMTGLYEYNIQTGDHHAILEDFSISAVDFYNATLTPSNLDELALLDLILAGNDTITLASGPDQAYGRGGNDLINSAGGNDTLLGEGGNDTLIAAGGADSLLGGDGVDSINGGAGNDWIDGGNQGDVINGAGNNDTIYGQAGNDTIQGGLGLDTVDGGSGADSIQGNDGADSLFGGLGNDSLYGGNQADRLDGGDQNDLLVGGLGIDVMTGGLGTDTFQWNVNDFGTGLRTGTDRITDFSQAQADRIDLSLIDASTTAAGNNAFSFIGTAAFASDGVGGRLRFEQVGVNTFVEGDRNGDGLADWAIRLDGLITLTAADFVL